MAKLEHKQKISYATVPCIIFAILNVILFKIKIPASWKKLKNKVISIFHHSLNGLVSKDFCVAMFHPIIQPSMKKHPVLTFINISLQQLK